MRCSAPSLRDLRKVPFAAPLLLVWLLPATFLGQAAGSFGHPDTTRVVHSTAPNTGIVTFNVFAERNGAQLNRQALVKLVNLANQSVTWQTTGQDSQSVVTDIPYGKYDAEVSAVGYLSSHQELNVISIKNILQIDVVLHRDPAAINLNVADEGLSPKTRKETKHAVTALKSGNLKEAQKHLDEALKTAPSSSDVNFLLGYLYFQRKDFAQAENYLTTAVNLSPHNAQSLTLLGRTHLERKDYPVARTALEQAVLADAENWLPHDLLADTYLHEKSYEKARDEARIAIAKGKDAASSAQLTLGQALINLGHAEEGIQALNIFLQESPQHPAAGQVRDLIAEIQDRDSPSTPTEMGTQTKVRLSGIDPLSALPATRLSIRSWQPPGVDEVNLAVAPDVACPAQKVIEESGKRVQELVEDLARFSAIEDLFHQALDEYGVPVRTENRKFDYVASISEPRPGFLSVDEFRADNLNIAGYPDHISSTGFATLAFVFHPHMRDNFNISCEGLGDWHGQPSWLVHFVQRDDRPNTMHSYKVGNKIYPVKLKGRAWITADKFQIVRIEAEMASSMPEIQLLSEHQVVEYGPIPFQKKNISLWLPKTVELYFDFRKHRYYRRHSFDHYMLFAVDSEAKQKEPVSKPPS
jgi:tetratricopeptide (TPR) repeat protein